jgi:hypothetical protein
MPRNTTKSKAAAKDQQDQPVEDTSLPGEGVKNEDATEGQVVDRDTAIRQSYGDALKALKDKHLDEFNGLRQGIIRRLGHDWSPPLTERQKTEQAIREAIAADPELAAKLLAEQGITQPKEG